MKLFLRFPRVAAFIAFLTIVAWSVFLHDRIPETLKRPNMTSLSNRLQPLFAETKTVCFGQFVLDVPSSATVVYGPADVDYPIEYWPGEGAKIVQHVADHLAEVEKDRIYIDKRDRDQFSLYGTVIDGAAQGQKLVFGSKNQIHYSIYSFVPIGDDLFVQYADTARLKERTLKMLNATANLLRLRAENEVPTEVGTCIDGGFVALQPEYERASIGVRLKEFPDVHFSVEAVRNVKYLVESNALEPRLKEAEKEGGLAYMRIKFFRRGPRQLENWSGYEVLARKPAHGKSTESHEFAFVSLGAIDDSLRPNLDVKLDTGVKNDKMASVEPSLTDEEAVALWDKLITTIRVRPTGDAAKKAAAATPKTPLGTVVVTGSECPQAGWWQCSDHGDVAGGRRRHFIAGETMPQAALKVKPNIFQKVKGERPIHMVTTTWQLVVYDDEPTVEHFRAPSDI